MPTARPMTSVAFDPVTFERLRAIAAQDDRSVASLIRLAVDHWLTSAEGRDKARKANDRMKRVASGHGDITDDLKNVRMPKMPKHAAIAAMMNEKVINDLPKVPTTFAAGTGPLENLLMAAFAAAPTPEAPDAPETMSEDEGKE